MIRRISTKLVLAVLTAVVLPFVVFAFYVSDQMGARLTRHVVQQALTGLAGMLAEQVDYFLQERHQDLVQWSGLQETRRAVEESLAEKGALRANGSATSSVWNADLVARWAQDERTPADFDRERMIQRSQLTEELNRFVELKQVYDVLLLVGVDGRLVTASTRHPAGPTFEAPYLQHLFARDFGREEWFRSVLETGASAQVDHHVSPYQLFEVQDPEEIAWGYHLGFAAPVKSNVVPDKVIGVLYAVVNWYFVQEIVGTPVVRDYFRGLVNEEQEPSPYAWIWARDADTILGHPKRPLYYQSVSRDVRLPQLTQAVLDSAEGFGLYPEYEFEGERKNAAFKRCRSAEQGGFGWVVGVGIDNDDIYSTAYELRDLILGGTALVSLMAVMWTFLIARRTTDPILELQRYTRRVAEGELDVQVTIRSKDELGALAEDFNRMTRRLREQREHLVRAEKDAAWREMARQIAHDLKNPLTPIRLSIDLLERARLERPEDSDEILVRTLSLIRRQVVHLQEIAGDFYEFTGGHKLKLQQVDIGELVDEVLHLHDAWAVDLGVEVHRAGVGGSVTADLSKLRRVFVNLVSNALQAMPDGGSLYVECFLEGDHVRTSFRDTGQGLAAEAREHLFEPYFTTRSEGTGLGLAISKQVIEQMAGSIEVVSAEGGGTVATVRLAVGGPPVVEHDS